MLSLPPQVSSKGSLTGGYFNKSRSRLEIQKIRSEKSEEIREQEEEMRKLRDDLAKLEADINKVSLG
jgi:structural maintenance of chromosome 3 (chondroitin sulfate proteoglycan 6)